MAAEVQLSVVAHWLTGLHAMQEPEERKFPAKQERHWFADGPLQAWQVGSHWAASGDTGINKSTSSATVRRANATVVRSVGE